MDNLLPWYVSSVARVVVVWVFFVVFSGLGARPPPTCGAIAGLRWKRDGMY